MDNNPLHRGSSMGASHGIPPVTREMVRARTRELALLANRVSSNVSQADYEQAKRELTGESDFDRQEAVLEAADEAYKIFGPERPEARLESNPDDRIGSARKPCVPPADRLDRPCVAMRCEAPA